MYLLKLTLVMRANMVGMTIHWSGRLFQRDLATPENTISNIFIRFSVNVLSIFASLYGFGIIIFFD